MKGSAYYNEIEPYCAQWLRNLIAEGHIASGDVDERSIVDVRGSDLISYTQCHFFAGIGGWSYALRLAGWDDDRPVWTGSCPCQPFSVIGKRGGTEDPRHLWPELLRLISERNPAVVFGEQVASKDGREWLAGVFADLEAMGYMRGGGDLCAAGVGAPHIRQRLYWVGDSIEPRLEGHSGNGNDRDQSGRLSAHPSGPAAETGWTDAERVSCLDGKTRRIEPGLCPVATRLPSHMGRLRAYGNAIVPQVAAAFIGAYLECRP